jgi:hypothetical protein
MNTCYISTCLETQFLLPSCSPHAEQSGLTHIIPLHPQNIKTKITMPDTFFVFLFCGQLLSLSALVLHGEKY